MEKKQILSLAVSKMYRSEEKALFPTVSNRNQSKPNQNSA